MKTLIVEDDLSNRLLLHGILQTYGECHIAVNGQEAVTAFGKALGENAPYDLVCLDIMMPEMDGQETLRRFRKLEEEAGILMTDGVRVIMSTALDDKKNIMTAFREQCDAYLVKPIDTRKLKEHLKSMRLID